MFFLTSGRVHLLEFLRNLGPQAVLLSLGLLAGIKLDFGKIDLSNWFATGLFWMFILIFCLCAYANISLFIERCVGARTRLAKYKGRLRQLHVRGFPHTYHAMKFTWQHERIFFLELTVLAVVLEFGLSSMLMTAITSTLSIYKILQ